jgi:hypothetical protein
VGPDDTYDVKKYVDLLVKATEEILIHVGYDVKRLKKITSSPCSSIPLGRGENEGRRGLF